MIRTYFDGQKPLGNVKLTDGTSDNGDYVSRQDMLDELARLRGEVERLQRVLGIDKAMADPNGWNHHRSIIAEMDKKLETAEARARELEAKLSTMQSVVHELDNIAHEQTALATAYEKNFHDTESRVRELEKELAELRARKPVDKGWLRSIMLTAISQATGEGYSEGEHENIELYAHAIHNALPPAPDHTELVKQLVEAMGKVRSFVESAAPGFAINEIDNSLAKAKAAGF